MWAGLSANFLCAHFCLSLKSCECSAYGTFGLWGAMLGGGDTVVSKRTFRSGIVFNHFIPVVFNISNLILQYIPCVQGFRSMGSEMPFGSINNLLLLPFAKSDSQILLTHQSSPANLHILYVQPQRHLSENFSDVIFGTKSINFAITMALSRHFIGHCPLFLFFFLLQIMITIFQGCTMGSGLPQLDLYLKMSVMK